MSIQPASWRLLIVVNVLFFCVLGFYQTSRAAPKKDAQPPFANSVGQRQEIIEQLKEVNRQLRQQNALLQNGRLTVVIAEQDKN